MKIDSKPPEPVPPAPGSAFDVWWHNEGSGMPPLPGEDSETHTRRICEIAWSNGAYKAYEALESIIKQQPCCEGGGRCHPMHGYHLTIESFGLRQSDAASYALQLIGSMMQSAHTQGHSCGGETGNACGNWEIVGRSDPP